MFYLFYLFIFIFLIVRRPWPNFVSKGRHTGFVILVLVYWYCTQIVGMNLVRLVRHGSETNRLDYVTDTDLQLDP